MPIKTIDLTAIDTYINPVYRKYLEDYRRFQIFKGGAGAGKSYFVGQKIVYNMITVPGYNVLALREIGRDNHDSTFAEICKSINELDLNGVFDINHSRGAEEITCKATGNRVIFRGLFDVLNIKSITFPTGDLVCIWIEEASEIVEQDFNQLNLRIRGIGTINKHIILSFNPIDADHWIKHRFFDEKLEKKRGLICETVYKDNDYIDDEYKAELESYERIDEYYYMVYVLNKWGMRSTARVFHNIVIEDFKFEEHDLQNRRFGIDFGYNHANACIGIGYRDGELYLWSERYAKHQLNASFISSANDIPKDYVFKADSAEPDKIREWNNAGFTQCYGTEKYPGLLRRGIDYLKSLPVIHIHKTRCPNAAREFRNLKYRELKGGIILDEIVEINDDTVSAVRYAVDDFVTDSGQSHFFIKARNN